MELVMSGAWPVSCAVIAASCDGIWTMCGVRKISSSFFWFDLAAELEKIAEQRNVAQQRNLALAGGLVVGNEAADDDGLAVGRHDHGVGGTFVDVGRIHGGRNAGCRPAITWPGVEVSMDVICGWRIICTRLFAPMNGVTSSWMPTF